MASRSNLKKRILVHYQGGREVRTGGIHQYFEDLNRAPNAESEPKDFFEMASERLRAAPESRPRSKEINDAACTRCTR
jgi:hypothetical protein